VWFYTCCFPGGPWLNRLLDMELLRPALFGWAAARFRLDGFLHWGLNHYRPDQDPFQQSVVGHGGDNRLPAGDTHIVYPGPDGPWSSVRLEAQREGFEDYEMLTELGWDRVREGLAIVRPVLRGFDRYTKDVTVLREARRRLYAAATEAQHARELDLTEIWAEHVAEVNAEGARSTDIFLCELRHTLQALALPLPQQTQWWQHFIPADRDSLPAPAFRVYYECIAGRPEITLTEAQRVALDGLQDLLESSHWETNALTTMAPTSLQLRIRSAAMTALNAFGWPAETPPLPRNLHPPTEDQTSQRYKIWTLCRSLHHARMRPGMYFVQQTAENALTYVWGIKMALSSLCPEDAKQRDVLREAEAHRGWRRDCMHFSHRLIDRGWSDRAIIDEIIAVEIDALSLMLEQLDASD
jgi:hypothetical protein